MSFLPAEKPESVKSLTDKQIVLQCIQRLADTFRPPVLYNMDRFSEDKLAYRRLTCGAVKRSKVDGVNSVPGLIKFVEDLGEPTMMVMKPGTNNPLLKFEVLSPYRAVTPVVRLQDLDLHTRGRMYASGISPCVVRKKTDAGITWEYRLHAPNIYPVKTDAVTFILSPDWTSLVEWFAGEEPALWEPSGNLGSQWVYLGVDLVEENIRRNTKQYGHPRSSIQAPRPFVPSAPPVPEPRAALIST